MQEKLVEEWLIRAGERGGIDQAFGQHLISEGHEILWLGHSSTEFGKDIISVAPDGSIHAFQMKDEDISLNDLRKITPQLIELTEIPCVHPRIPAGTRHLPYLVTSGLCKKEAVARIRATNEGLRARGLSELQIIERNGLIPRFVRTADSFWPERPTDIRDFFSFYLADGKGDFDPMRFSSVLCGLLSGKRETSNRKGQRIAAVGLLGNYLLNPFEREKDFWSLFCGWTIIAAHIAWYAERNSLIKKRWMPSFRLAKLAAIEHLIALSIEALGDGALVSQGMEFDDYARSRNLLVASALAASCILGQGDRIGGVGKVNRLLDSLLNRGRLCCWGESAIPHILGIQWHLEEQSLPSSALPLIKGAISALCERNHPRSGDEPFPDPWVSPDEILSKLFSHLDQQGERKIGGESWALESLVHFLARRGQRVFLEANWRAITKLEMAVFRPASKEDILVWKCSKGRAEQFHLEQTQSWRLLVQAAAANETSVLPDILVQDHEFALMYLLAYPHRISSTIVGLLDPLSGRHKND